MYLILCWSYLNHSSRSVGKKRGQKKNRILNRNSNILLKNRNEIIFPNRSALLSTQTQIRTAKNSWSQTRPLPHAPAMTDSCADVLPLLVGQTEESGGWTVTVCSSS